MSAPTEPRRRGPLTAAVAAGLTGWFIATVVVNLPDPTLDRIRTYDPFGLVLGSWRFFAPQPARHDLRLLHRTLRADGTSTPWQMTLPVYERSARQMVWFPERRDEKAMVDVIGLLQQYLQRPGARLTRSRLYQLLRDVVAEQVRHEHRDGEPPQGFQFVVAMHAGYDGSEEPRFVLSSPFEPLPADAR
jgi:hypothetical protein